MDSDIRNVTNTNVRGAVQDFAVDSQTIDSPQDQNETTWDFNNFPQWLGYYNTIPELKKAIQTYGTWVVGQGFDVDLQNTKQSVILDHINGWGEDSFTSILWNMLIMKKVNGDAFAEIVRDPKTKMLLNLKPLTPERMTIVVNRKGRIKEYRYRGIKQDSAYQTFKPREIFHLCNDRIADQIHGDSVVEALRWLIDARQEAMQDWRRISHRSTIRIIYTEEDNPTKLSTMKAQYQSAIKNGEVMVLPGKRNEYEAQDLNLPPVDAFLSWIRYLENAFYKAVGVPKTLAGDAEGIPESGGKMVVLTHEPTYIREVTDLEKDLWNQVGIKITFKRQASIKDNVQETDAKNVNQTQATQPGDTQI